MSDKNDQVLEVLFSSDQTNTRTYEVNIIKKYHKGLWLHNVALSD